MRNAFHTIKAGSRMNKIPHVMQKREQFSAILNTVAKVMPFLWKKPPTCANYCPHACSLGLYIVVVYQHFIAVFV